MGRLPPFFWVHFLGTGGLSICRLAHVFLFEAFVVNSRKPKANRAEQ